MLPRFSILNKYCSFELSIHQKSWKKCITVSTKIISSTTDVLNIDKNIKCFLIRKSVQIIIIIHNITGLLFWLNKCGFGEHKRFLKKKKLKILNGSLSYFAVIDCIEAIDHSCHQSVKSYLYAINIPSTLHHNNFFLNSHRSAEDIWTLSSSFTADCKICSIVSVLWNLQKRSRV